MTVKVITNQQQIFQTTSNSLILNGFLQKLGLAVVTSIMFNLSLSSHLDIPTNLFHANKQYRNAHYKIHGLVHFVKCHILSEEAIQRRRKATFQNSQKC